MDAAAWLKIAGKIALGVGFAAFVIAPIVAGVNAVWNLTVDLGGSLGQDAWAYKSPPRPEGFAVGTMATALLAAPWGAFGLGWFKSAYSLAGALLLLPLVWRFVIRRVLN